MTLIIPNKFEYITPVEGTDFEYVENDAKALTIRLLTEPFTGVVYMYGAVKLKEGRNARPEDEFFEDPHEVGEQATLQFHYEILENKERVLTRHYRSFEFFVGRILETILRDALENDKTKYDMITVDDEGKIVGLNPLDRGKIDGISVWNKVKNWFTSKE